MDVGALLTLASFGGREKVLEENARVGVSAAKEGVEKAVDKAKEVAGAK